MGLSIAHGAKGGMAPKKKGGVAKKGVQADALEQDEFAVVEGDSGEDVAEGTLSEDEPEMDAEAELSEWPLQ